MISPLNTESSSPSDLQILKITLKNIYILLDHITDIFILEIYDSLTAYISPPPSRSFPALPSQTYTNFRHFNDIIDLDEGDLKSHAGMGRFLRHRFDRPSLNSGILSMYNTGFKKELAKWRNLVA